jgi:hypothetical protein
VKAATLHRSDFVQQNAANTKTNNSDLKNKWHLVSSYNVTNLTDEGNLKYDKLSNFIPLTNLA